jgi:hypothetical protein
MDELNPEIEPPEEYAWIWDWFWELSASRRQGQNGPDPITYQDIAIWLQVTGNRLLREEVTIIRAMDDAFVTALAQEHREQRERDKTK